MENIEKIIEEINKKINSVDNIKDLNDLKVEYMGKKGVITELQSGIKEASDKKEYGMKVNMLRTTFSS